ncbi:hypothetical protein [Treponema sp.]|nr:hypothetical protein [Treponema sp.]
MNLVASLQAGIHTSRNVIAHVLESEMCYVSNFFEEAYNDRRI